MPKAAAFEYFEVTVQCPKEVLGELMSDINKRGLDKVHFNLVTAVKSFAKNVQPNGISSDAFLAEWIKEHPTFKANEAVKAFKADGRGNGTTAYHTMTKAVEAGLLKKLDEGMYARADVKALPAPKKTKKTRQSKGPPKRFDKRGEDVILSYARRNHGRFNTEKLVEVFTGEGRARNSVYASIDVLMKAKLVKRVGDAGSGQYVLLAKAAKPKTKPKAPPKKAANGHAVEVEVPATPGV